MKYVAVTFFALVTIASAGVLLPQTYGLGLASPLINAYAPYYAAPIAVAAPAIQTGYVAANRGAVHTAPLPEGPFAFSHHINTAPAPGTW